MRLLVLGASGGCGRHVVRLARDAGHEVTALVRPETPYDAPQETRTVRGSALDAGDVARAGDGCDAFVSCIGPQRWRPWNPWSAIREPAGSASGSAAAIVQAAYRVGVRRVVAISAGGVGDSAVRLNAMMRLLIAWSNLGPMYADLASMESMFRESDLDWVAVRPVTLVNSSGLRPVRALARYGYFSVIGRRDVAAWLVRAATDPAPVSERTPLIGWW